MEKKTTHLITTKRKGSNLNQMYGFVYQHKNGKVNIKWKALLPHSCCWKSAVGSPLKQTLNSSSPSASAKSHWLKNKAEKHSLSRSKSFPILRNKVLWGARRGLLLLCWSFSICNVLWLPSRLETPLSLHQTPSSQKKP